MTSKLVTGFLLLTIVLLSGGMVMAQDNKQTAILAGGCFWCLEGPFDALKGVLETHVGYTGGSKEDATYRAVSTGRTGHYEAIKVVFDPAVISYSQIIDVFWRQIDPTQADGQFADIGPQYRTAIFYMNDEQKQLAEKSKADLMASGKFSEPVVTEIKPAAEFYLAEEDHQDYYQKAPEHYKRYKYGSGRAGFQEKNWGK